MNETMGHMCVGNDNNNKSSCDLQELKLGVQDLDVEERSNSECMYVLMHNIYNIYIYIYI